MVDAIVAAIRALSPRNTASVRALRRQFSRRLAQESGPTVLRLVRALLARAEVPRFFAYEICACHSGAPACVDERAMRALAGRLASWSDVDCFAIYVAGPAWRAKRVTDAAIMDWTRSPDRWWRRAALVSTVPLNAASRGGYGDARRTVRVCAALRADRDPMVAKALSWALRELSKRDAKAVRRFIDAYERELPALVVREVRNKLQLGVKSPRRSR